MFDSHQAGVRFASWRLLWRLWGDLRWEEVGYGVASHDW